MPYDSVDAVRIGNKLKDLRQNKNKTLEELASELCISQSAVGMYETGQRIPRDEIKIRIAEYFGVPVEAIFFPRKQHETCDN